MIDLHCHMLPGIDDGSKSLQQSLDMARAAVADGIRVTACTPHIYPGLYENTAAGIRRARQALQAEIKRAGIALTLVDGADTHLVPEVLDGLRTGRIPTLAGSRYLLLEPPHHVAPQRFEESVFALQAAGYVPVITHPERLGWIGAHYAAFSRLAVSGCWMQVTAGAVTGAFGREPKQFAERLLGEGLVAILATDAHDLERRPPCLSQGRAAAARIVGDEEATHLVLTRPKGILRNADPQTLPAIPALSREATPPARSWMARLFSGRRSDAA